jgi:hypothetical protein
MSPLLLRNFLPSSSMRWEYRVSEVTIDFVVRLENRSPN